MAALPATLSLYDQPEPIGGAEADIFMVHERSTLLVKLFKTELTPQREALIRTMCARAGQAGVAWPYALRRFHQRPGLVLPRIAGQELHVLTSRTTRMQHFPDSSWHLAIAAAANYARACAAVHAQNLAIVDVSARNALVDARGAVTLIDADSFLPPGGTAVVATEEYQAPETLGRLPLSWQIQYDLHGIALILFELLFQKASPWPHDAGDARGRFRFRRRTRIGLKPWEPGLDDLTPLVATLFGRAFGSASPQPPRATEWAEALTDMERLVRSCPRVATHAYVSGKGRQCPWCACATRPEGIDPYRLPDASAPVSPPPPTPAPVRRAKVVPPAPRSRVPVYLFVLALLVAAIWMNAATLSRAGSQLARWADGVVASLGRWTDDPEDQRWERASTGGFTDAETFLLRYPESDHAAAARVRLARLAADLPLGPAPRRVTATIKVRIRNAPSLASDRIGYVEPGRSVRPLGSVRNGRWYAIRHKGGRAYVAESLMKAPERPRAKPRRSRVAPAAVVPEATGAEPIADRELEPLFSADDAVHDATPAGERGDGAAIDLQSPANEEPRPSGGEGP